MTVNITFIPSKNLLNLLHIIILSFIIFLTLTTGCKLPCRQADCIRYNDICMTRYCKKLSWFDARQRCQDQSQTLVSGKLAEDKKSDLLKNSDSSCRELWTDYHKTDWFSVLNGSKKYTFYKIPTKIFSLLHVIKYLHFGAIINIHLPLCELCRAKWCDWLLLKPFIIVHFNHQLLQHVFPIMFVNQFQHVPC